MVIRRMYSVPEHITMAGLSAGAIGAIYPVIQAHTGVPGLACPLRTLTGVPCPFCGLTTATVALTHGQWVTAAATSPLWGQRVGAYLIDVAPIVILEIIFVRLVFALFIVVMLASIGWTIYNRWYQGGTTGQSLGKKVLKIRLISEQTGQPIGPLMAFARDICHIVDSIICYVGFLFPLWDAKRQTLADKIVSTVVVVDANGF